jgi:hypothetical protein
MSQTPFAPGAPGNFRGIIQQKLLEDYDKLTPEQRFQFGQNYLGGGEFSGLADALKVTKESPEEFKAKRKAETEAKLEEARAFQEIGKESAKEAFKYEMLGRLPQQVMQAFAVPAQISSNIQLAGQNAANQIIAEGLRASDVNMFNMGYQQPTFKYFS